MALIVLPASLHAAEWHRGENLLTSFLPVEEEWVAYARTEGSFDSRLWRKKGDEESESYAVSILRDHEQKLDAFRRDQDAPGEAKCDDFLSETLDETPTNGYPRLMWRTLCRNRDGFTASILQVALQGRDSFYHVQKIWRVEPSREDVDRWTNLLGKTSLCDTRRKKHPCPEGFERID